MEEKCLYLDEGEMNYYCLVTTMLCEERDYKKCRVYKITKGLVRVKDGN